MLVRLVTAAIACALPGVAAAQGRAEGTYPGTLFCERTPFLAPSRDPVTLTVANGKASFSRALTGVEGGGTEAAGGVVQGGRLVLSGGAKGRGAAFESRYEGEIGGRGGLLTGVQTWTRGGQTVRRACQLTIGSGRA